MTDHADGQHHHHHHGHNQHNQHQQHGIELLYAPPKHALTGTLEEACREAEMSGKYLIVSVVNPRNFGCLALNRDVWSAPGLEGCVTGFYRLFQCQEDEKEGAEVALKYGVQRLPFAAVVDPVTKEPVWRVEVDRWAAGDGLYDVEKACDTLTSWALEHEGELLPYSPPGASGFLRVPARTPSSSSSVPPTIDADSPSPSPSPVQPPLPWAPDPRLDNFCCSSPSSVFIRWRFPDGSVLQRQLLPSTPLSLLHDIVRLELEEARGRRFAVHAGFPPAPVPDVDQISVAAAKLEEEELTVAWC